VLVGSSRALWKAVTTADTKQRYTLLKWRLMAELGESRPRHECVTAPCCRVRPAGRIAPAPVPRGDRAAQSRREGKSWSAVGDRRVP
jgi:hypothetical protein